MNALLFLQLFLYGAISHPTPEANAKLIISNIKSEKGTFIISFYDMAANFPRNGKELLTYKIAVKDTLPHTIKVTVPAEGWYAIAMYQDEDDNGEIKQDKIGIPEEPYAFSNNIHPKIEVPKFEECKFFVARKDNEPIRISLIQPGLHLKKKKK